MHVHKDKTNQKENKLSKIDKTILDNFYKLVHTNQDVRIRASVSTYKILCAMKKNKPAAFNEHLNYCVERLVAGLASSRAMARRGYATLLLEILENHQVSTERLLTIGLQKFGNISNETTSDNLLGYFLLITIIIESGTYKRSKQNVNLLEKMYKYLTQLIRIKSYFDYPVSKFLTKHFIIFHPHLLADIPPEIFGTGVKIPHTELLKLVLCNKVEPMREFTSLDGAAVENLSSSLSSDRLQNRPLHPIWVEYSKLLINHMPQQFESLYNKILAPTFFKPNHNELVSMGLELTATLLESSHDASIIKTILSDHVVRLLILSQRSRNSLHEHCVTFFKNLTSSFERSLKDDKDNGNEEASKAEDRQYFILRRLTSAPGSVAFDEDSRSSSIVKLLNHCHTNVLVRYLDGLSEILSKKFPTDKGMRFHIACTKQIAHILHRPQLTNAEHLDTIQRSTKFLIVNSMFKSISLDKNDRANFYKSHNIPPFIDHLDSTVRDALKSTYQTAMARLVTVCSTSQRIETFGHLVDFCDQLFKIAKVEFYPDSERTNDLWPVYYSSLNEHRKLVKRNDDSKILYPLSNLYLFYGLQVVEHGLECKTQLEELAQSSTEALKNDPNDGSWADVLTDQIIAILSATECSQWICKLCVSVFGSLLPHVSEVSIDLICEAMTSPPDGLESDCSDEERFDNEDGASDEDEESDEDSSDDETVGGNESSGVITEETLSEEENLDEEHHSGEEMVCEEGADEKMQQDEEYLSDEQMMKLDSVIADMFRLKKVEKANSKSKSVSRKKKFQLRLLELAKKILSKKKDANLLAAIASCGLK